MTPHFAPDLHTRPARPADLAAVTALVTAAELHDIGEVFLSSEDLEAGWNRPDFDLGSDSVLVYHNDVLVAWGEVYGGRADAAVLPTWRERGLGSQLLAWTEARAADLGPINGKLSVGQTLPDGATDAISLLVANGYSPTHTSWALSLPDSVQLQMPALPGGVAIRPYLPGPEERAIYQVVEDAFNEWPNRTPQTFEQWQSWVTARPDFDRELLLVAVDGDEVVGTGFGLEYPDEGWVEQLAVRGDRRGLGLGKALLTALFSTFREKQFANIGVSTDSRTGALDLYVGLGMNVDHSFTRYTKDLGGSDADDQA